MFLKILFLVLLSIGAVVSIYDPKYIEKTKSYRRDPHIARELHRHHHQHGLASYRPDNYPRLSVGQYQNSENVEQQERHANYNRPGRDYANNIDDYYGGCPSGFTGQLPYPYDCRRFVNCWKGRAYIQTCGPGTVFNGETMECDSPTKVVCQGLSALPRVNPQPTNHRSGRLLTDVLVDDVACPEGYTGLLPHPHDCSKFLNCASGTMHIQSCGPQTMFSPSMKVCDFAHKVDCSGRNGGGSYNAPTTPTVSGNRGGKTYDIIARENQAVNQELPPRKGGWPHHHGHHHHHGYPNPPPASGSFVHHHHHNCTDHRHGHQSSPPPAVQTPLIYRDRWSTMNRTRPTVPGGRPTWQQTTTSSTPDRTWTYTSQSASRWNGAPVPETTTRQSTWLSHGSSSSSWTTTTARPQSNYPNTYYGNSPNRTDLQHGTTNIYYAQPVDEDQPSDEVFSNIYGADISEVHLPSDRRNASRGVVFNPSPPSHPAMDSINIPNTNLMPPHRSDPSDDRQSPIPEQYPDFSSRQPSYIVPQSPFPQRPKTDSFHRTGVFAPRSDNSWAHTDNNHPSMDAINIPSMDLLPPLPSAPVDDDRQSEIPLFPVPRPQTTPPYNSPSYGVPAGLPSSSRFNTTTIFISTPASMPDPQPTWIINDESNLFGGLLPPLPTVPESQSPLSPTSQEPPTQNEYTPLSPPSTPTTPLRPSYPNFVTTTTTPLPGVKTNVRVYQIYPPPAVQNATTRIHPDPFYSPSYSGVAHSRNTTWTARPPIKTSVPSSSRTTPLPRSSSTATFIPRDNFEPEVIFSHEGGVVIPSQAKHMMSTTTTERHGVVPPNYNREFYKQTTPSSVYRAPAETDTSDEVGQMPISEALRLLLRPYFNRSGTVTDDMATKAETHIMSLSRSKEPTTTSTSTSTSTTTSTVAPVIDKDVEIVFAGEQNSLHPSYAHPIHSPVHPPSKYHQLHDRNFHRTHPHVPNPFENELEDRDDDVQFELTTPRTWQSVSTTTEAAVNPAVDDVCQFDCGNGKCVKTFETCDGVNNCGNRRDEEKCEHLGYDIRLSNGDSGRVEVKILGQWGYVCDDKFGIQDANVVCREVGFPLGASDVRGNSFYPPIDGGEVAFIMDEVDCIGTEKSLKECPFMGWGISDCGADEVVGVQCKTPVMKCPNDYWLCSTSKECIPPAFVCDNVPDCSDQSDESSAVCNSTVEYRLKGGRSKQEGRLEVLYRGVWGTICDDDFGQTEAQVACNSLGYYGPAKIVKNAFGPGSGPIWLDQVSCFGNESSVDTCTHWSWGEHNCNHTEDVSLKCTAGSPPRATSTGIKGSSKPTDDEQATTLDDIGLDLYPMERSSKFANNRKVCGHFNANLTEELPREFERVVKGNTAKRGHHPWQATIRTKGRGGISSHWCGAVLISKKHLLTAAHCLVGYPKGAYFIRLGDHYANIAESSEIDSYIENWYIHEKFRDGTHMNNDIAIIVMKNPVRFNDYIQPICLPPEGTKYEEGRQCTISGWGSIQSGVSTPSNRLQVAQIPVISDETCKLPHVYGNSITEGMFCAGFLEEGVDACEGDSGGPFVCSDSDAETLYGIISWGQQCGHANKPGVYVKIEKYLDWIYERIRFSMQQTN